MREIKSGNFSFIILDKYNYCRASTLNFDRYDSVEISVEF